MSTKKRQPRPRGPSLRVQRLGKSGGTEKRGYDHLPEYKDDPKSVDIVLPDDLEEGMTVFVEAIFLTRTANKDAVEGFYLTGNSTGPFGDKSTLPLVGVVDSVERAGSLTRIWLRPILSGSSESNTVFAKIDGADIKIPLRWFNTRHWKIVKLT